MIKVNNFYFFQDLPTNLNTQTLTEYKFERLGTQEGVRREFENELKNQRKFMGHYPDQGELHNRMRHKLGVLF
jgi:hypothetical protein